MPFRESMLAVRCRSSDALITVLGYIADGKDPILPPGMRDHLKADLDKSFDF